MSDMPTPGPIPPDIPKSRLVGLGPKTFTDEAAEEIHRVLNEPDEHSGTEQEPYSELPVADIGFLAERPCEECSGTGYFAACALDGMECGKCGGTGVILTEALGSEERGGEQKP
jgi:ribosomal protein S27AE